MQVREGWTAIAVVRLVDKDERVGLSVKKGTKKQPSQPSRNRNWAFDSRPAVFLALKR